MSDTSATRPIPKKDHEALYRMLEPGDRTAALKLLKHKFSAAYVAMVADPKNCRYNAEVIDALIRAVEMRSARTVKAAQRVNRLHANKH